jgi:hypothetical protein
LLPNPPRLEEPGIGPVRVVHAVALEEAGATLRCAGATCGVPLVVELREQGRKVIGGGMASPIFAIVGDALMVAAFAVGRSPAAALLWGGVGFSYDVWLISEALEPRPLGQAPRSTWSGPEMELCWLGVTTAVTPAELAGDPGFPAHLSAARLLARRGLLANLNGGDCESAP